MRLDPLRFALIATIWIAAALPAPAGQWDTCTPSQLLPWNTGPYGTNVKDVAEDFTIPVLDDAGNPGATWGFQAAWSGCDNYVFVSYHPNYQYARDLWNSSIDDLLAQSPLNVHYVFLSFQAGASAVLADVRAIRTRVEAAIDRLADPADRAYWRARFHYCTQSAFGLGNWVSTKLQARGVFAWAIDRAQRIRDVGLLYHPGYASPIAELAFTTHETRYYNFEWAREQDLAALPSTNVVVWDKGTVAGNLDGDLVLPDAATMARYDTMVYDLTLDCAGHDEQNCGEWDYLIYLFACDEDDPTRCNTEIGRWITTYGREGRWVTDASPYLAFLRNGGTRRVRFYSSNSYEISLTVRLATTGKGTRPYAATYLYGGGTFNQNYNPAHPPKDVAVPAWAVKTDLVAIVSGHGFGDNAENCAEFCNHQHRFTFDGTPFLREHRWPDDYPFDGCIRQIEDGTVPNQYGTWPFGRGGWCPGLDVPAWVEDVTGAVTSPVTSVLYEGLYQGQPYTPGTIPNPNGFAARIDLNSWLVFHVPSPEADCANSMDDDGDLLTDCADAGCFSDPACALEDADGDGIPNSTDNCPVDPNAGQENLDGDIYGDACDFDVDGDGARNERDNCLSIPNPTQANADRDAFGDECDDCTDTDGDGFGNPGYPANTCAEDNCPAVSNDQTDTDGDLLGDPCDNCPNDSNPGQEDADTDLLGDACDTCTDTDGDGAGDPGYPANTCPEDNCPQVANPGQEDLDGDTLGNACDPDADGDGLEPVGAGGTDCNDLDPESLVRPGEVGLLQVAKSGPDVRFDWESLEPVSGASLRYQLLIGTIPAAWDPFWPYYDASCFADPVQGTTETRSVAGSKYFLVRAKLAGCPPGSWGNSSLTPDPRDGLDFTSPCP